MTRFERIQSKEEMIMPQDSTGKNIKIGDRVRFHGQEFTIQAFIPNIGRLKTNGIEFTEKPTHTDEQPDEISVDLL